MNGPQRLRPLRRSWFSVTLYSLLSLFFLVAGVMSASTYVAVVDAHERIGFGGAEHSATELPDGALHISFSIDLVNPSRFELTLQTQRWDAVVYNVTAGGVESFTVATGYVGPGAMVTVGPRSTATFSFEHTVTDQAALARLEGFIAHQESLGAHMTLETIPYVHEFHLIAWLGDFEHDYLREFYLNDLVKVDRRYSSLGGGT